MYLYLYLSFLSLIWLPSISHSCNFARHTTYSLWSSRHKSAAGVRWGGGVVPSPWVSVPKAQERFFILRLCYFSEMEIWNNSNMSVLLGLQQEWIRTYTTYYVKERTQREEFHKTFLIYPSLYLYMLLGVHCTRNKSLSTLCHLRSKNI